VRLEALLAEGRTDAIDLRALPVMTESDLERLRSHLGAGEVTARVEAMGVTEVAETAFPGVWWATYYGGDGDIVAERIEIARIPEILVAQDADIRGGQQALLADLPEPEAEDGPQGPPIRPSMD
jgi:hydrogenase-1 operon protein HyaF